MSNLPPFSPTTLFDARSSLHISSSSSYSTHTHTHTRTRTHSCTQVSPRSSPWATRCYPRAIRAYYIYVFVATSPTCVGRNQGQERNRPATAPRAIDSTHRRGLRHDDDDDDDDDDTKGIARVVVVFTDTADLWSVIAAHSFTGNPVSFGSLAHGRDCLVIYLARGRMRVAPISYLHLCTPLPLPRASSEDVLC